MLQALITAAKAALCEILGVCQAEDECPDGVCEDAVAELGQIERKLTSPKVGVGQDVTSILDFVRCLDIPRFVNWVREGIAILNDAKLCPDDRRLGDAPDPQDG